jgi:hypothetical protein
MRIVINCHCVSAVGLPVFFIIVPEKIRHLVISSYGRPLKKSKLQCFTVVSLSKRAETNILSSSGCCVSGKRNDGT